MKNLMLISLIAVSGNFALASDGNSTGCFDVAVSVAKSIDKNGATAQSVLKTGAVLCVKESNMKKVDDVVSTGNISINMRSQGKTVAQYDLVASSSEGAAGTIYTTYALSVEDLGQPVEDVAYKVATFAMRNDHLKPGQRAGRVTLFGGAELTLIQR